MSEPTHIRAVLDEIVADLAVRLDRHLGARVAVLCALRLHEAGAEGFADVEPLALVAEMLELLPEEPAP